MIENLRPFVRHAVRRLLRGDVGDRDDVEQDVMLTLVERWAYVETARHRWAYIAELVRGAILQSAGRLRDQLPPVRVEGRY